MQIAASALPTQDGHQRGEEFPRRRHSASCRPSREQAVRAAPATGPAAGAPATGPAAGVSIRAPAPAPSALPRVPLVAEHTERGANLVDPVVPCRLRAPAPACLLRSVTGEITYILLSEVMGYKSHLLDTRALYSSHPVRSTAPPNHTNTLPQNCPRPQPCSHQHADIPTDALEGTRAHARTRTHARVCVCVCVHSYMPTCMLGNTQKVTHRSIMQQAAGMVTITHARTHARTHAHTHAHTHARARAHIHAHTRTRTRAHRSTMRQAAGTVTIHPAKLAMCPTLSCTSRSKPGLNLNPKP